VTIIQKLNIYRAIILKKKPLIEPLVDRESQASDLRTAVGNHIKKAMNHNYRYIDPVAVKNIMGKWAPLSISHFSYLIECFVAVVNNSGSSIMNSKGTYRTDIPGVPRH